MDGYCYVGEPSGVSQLVGRMQAEQLGTPTIINREESGIWENVEATAGYVVHFSRITLVAVALQDASYAARPVVSPDVRSV